MYPWHSIPGKRHGIVEGFFRKEKTAVPGATRAGRACDRNFIRSRDGTRAYRVISLSSTSPDRSGNGTLAHYKATFSVARSARGTI